MGGPRAPPNDTGSLNHDPAPIMGPEALVPLRTCFTGRRQGRIRLARGSLRVGGSASRVSEVR